MSRVKCNNCGDVIESKGRYDHVSCSCWESWLDGGDELMRGGGPFNQIEKSGIELDKLGEQLVAEIKEQERERIFELIQEFDWSNVWIQKASYDKTRWEGFREDNLLDYLKKSLYG
jgi:hypothetical protein